VFTYLQQARHLRLLEGPTPSFPTTAALTCRLGPPQLFGVADGPIRASRLGSSLELRWDANADRTYCQPSPGFDCLSVTATAMGGTFHVSGNDVTFRGDVASEEQFGRLLGLLLFGLPACLSSTLPDPVFLQSVEGMLGASRFRIEHLESVTPLIVLDDDGLAELVAAGLSAMDQVAAPEHARLLAATCYVQRAARLFAAGYSPWEFMAEALLNYSKALEVLFGDSREDQRTGLKALSIDPAEIETRFIPLTLLRDSLDVAHPKGLLNNNIYNSRLARYSGSVARLYANGDPSTGAGKRPAMASCPRDAE